MNTKILMTLSAIFLGFAGVSLLFLPQEIANFFNLTVSPISTLFSSICGSLYLGFAILNWMAKGNIIGGIYSRPVAIGNFMHFVIVTITLLKMVFTPQPNSTFLIILTGVYAIFGAAFGYVFMANPSNKNS